MNQALLQIIKENKGLIYSAIGAAMRGESPQSWIKNVARSNPKLQGYNLDDLEGTAAQVCKENNVDQNKLSSEVMEFANSFIQK